MVINELIDVTAVVNGILLTLAMAGNGYLHDKLTILPETWTAKIMQPQSG
ncbi:MAG: hypothetical protein AB7T07_14965 [Steroidobacteraceae bacterium]